MSEELEVETTVSVSTDIECGTCGDDLDSTWNGVTLSIEPCSSCLGESYNKGFLYRKDEGKEEAESEYEDEIIELKEQLENNPSSIIIKAIQSA